MKDHKTPDTAAGTPRDHFRTPRRPSPQSSSKTSKSTTSKRTSSPGLSTSGRAKKRVSLPSSYRAQSTLTQIHFVAHTPHPEDDELDYIDNTGGGGDARKAAQPVSIDDDPSEEDSEYRPPLRARPAPSTLGLNDDHPKRQRESAVVQRPPLRKRQTPKQSNGRGKRKSTDKPPAKRDKTLTQMDFVRRYITIDDDDDNDVNMVYLPPAPEKDLKEAGQQSDMAETKGVKPEPPLSCIKRPRKALEAEVDLSTGEPISQSDETQSLTKLPDPQDPSKSDIPTTPQKPRRLEIPSSQSPPESPGLAIITSSQFRSATRLPQKKARLNFAKPENSIKEESPGASDIAGESADEEDTIQNQTPTHSRPIGRNSPDPTLPSSLGNILPTVSSSAEVSQKSAPTDCDPPPERAQRERTVIYETDAETDNDDLEDDIGDGLDTPTRPPSPRLGSSNEIHDGPQSPCDGSQDLPLPSAHTCADPDSEPLSEAPMSDASMFYRRVQSATQFPHEPIPTLNTQKLSELFPNEGSTQYPRQGNAHHTQQPPLLSSQTQTQTQSQATDQIEIVPESSPTRDHDEDVFQRPQPPGRWSKLSHLSQLIVPIMDLVGCYHGVSF
ncbi:uncharacterized protein N7473_002867 [Penicillium subrubescens]|uniref:uncharacterized protein n=1 Tax=Penicillium subrubescens TaxID=1316194 RepID=UPI00254502BB|nr:uncharacterized protein N7473_002867 [Penicillium subrubescens]KAJ5905951.1 hypothetical protein N7473_002867 [Penicillium subrubescens]